MVTVVENSSNPTPQAAPVSTGSDAAGVGIGIGKVLGGVALVLIVLFVGYFLVHAQQTSERNSAARTRAISNAAESVSSSAANVADSVSSAVTR